jgi:hypothetical protein
MANTASRTAKYSGFLGSQYSAVFHYAKVGCFISWIACYGAHRPTVSVKRPRQRVVRAERRWCVNSIRKFVLAVTDWSCCIGSVFKPQSQTSGLAAIVAAAKVS